MALLEESRLEAARLEAARAGELGEPCQQATPVRSQAGQRRTGPGRPDSPPPALDAFVQDEDLRAEPPDLPPRRFAVGSWRETAFYAKDVLIGAGLLAGAAVLALSFLVSDRDCFRVVTLATGRQIEKFHAPLLVAAAMMSFYGIRRVCCGLLRWGRVSPRVDRFTRAFRGAIAFLAGPDRFHQ